MGMAVAWRPGMPSLKLETLPLRLQVVCRGSSGRGKAPLAARDMELPFGKYRGSMMGTLPSTYLKWMSGNMSGELGEWGKLAEEVLNDPFYRERLEWEQIERHMDKRQGYDALQQQLTGQRTSAIGPARAFGWDLDDQVGWSKVNFSLLGTTSGGRIPRLKAGGENEGVAAKAAGLVRPQPKARRKASDRKALHEMHSELRARYTGAASDEAEQTLEPVQPPAQPASSSLREEMLKRRQLRRDRVLATKGSRVKLDNVDGEVFPGREGLLRKIKDIS